VSDIFISYSKSDRAKAQVLAKALEREGWSVWWDPKITPGKSFDEVIERALEDARCVIVLWSKKSVSSRWVKAEASEANRREILVPALIEDDARIPLEFRNQHASRLTDWDGRWGHLEFEVLKDAVAQLLRATTTIAEGTSTLSLSSSLPVAAKTERTPLNEKVSEEVQAEPERSRSRGMWLGFGGKNLSTIAVAFLLSGIVAVALYVWINWPKAPTNRSEVPGVSRHDPPKHQGEQSQGKTPKAEPGRSPVYLDSTTGLLWTKSDNGHNVTWSQANGYCQNLRLGGYSNWRLPTLEELEKLYDPKAGDGWQIRGRPFKLTGWHVWSSTKRDPYSVWSFGFASGGRLLNVLNASDNMRALCVRGPGG
jgi:hypothetical protein